MAMTPVSMEDLADQENARLRESIERHRPAYGLANNTVSLISTGITGYAESRRVFGQYHSQVTISLTLALLSALRQHKTQVYSNLRLALEHGVLAGYALANPNHPYFDADHSEAAHKTFMTKTVYPWAKANHSDISGEIQRVKNLISNDHSHATIIQAKRNLTPIEGSELGVEVDFFDPTDDASIFADLIHVHYVGLLTLNLLIAVNNPDPKLRVRDGFGEEYRSLMALGRKLLPDNKTESSPA